MQIYNGNWFHNFGLILIKYICNKLFTFIEKNSGMSKQILETKLPIL